MERSKIKVTVGVCVKNAESTIRDAINSVLDQDFRQDRMEVVFVDDGSDDKTLSIIQNLTPRFGMHVEVIHTEWKGLGSARNTVVEKARGDYIVWVDGDMVIPRDHVTQQVNFMDENPDVGVAKAKYGSYPGENLIGILENAAFQAVDFKYKGDAGSRVLGTGGSIYRVKAIRQAGGFDVNISGVGEDADAENRVKKCGWQLYRGTPALFYEKRRRTWKALWDEGFWHGYGQHLIIRKDRHILGVHRMSPLAGFTAGVWYSITAYKLLHQKSVFLLPIQYTFKRTAWLIGFIKGQIDEIRSR